MRENPSHGMGGEGNGVRERVQRALAGPVAESEKLLADLGDADAETRLSILTSGWFRGLAAALGELATGAHRKEKCGLIARARLNQDRADGEPRQRSIIARWKTSNASRVPNRSARTECVRASSHRPVRYRPQASASSA